MSNTATVLNSPSLQIEPSSPARTPRTWNIRNYLLGNIGLALALTVVSYGGLVAAGGQELFNMWLMVTSHVHFCMSYLFHYATVKRSLVTPARHMAFWGFGVFGSLAFPVLYLKVVPYPLNSFLFMSYFMVHMMRDEQLMFYQRSSDYEERPKSHFAFVWLILIALLSVVAVFAPYRGSRVPAQELLNGFLRSDYLLLGILVSIAVWGMYALLRCESVRRATRLTACVVLLALTAVTGAFSFEIAQNFMSWDFNGPLIYLHYWSWYLFGGGRILNFDRKLKTGEIAPVVQSSDPWFKYKSSMKNFLKLVGFMHLVLVPIGLVWYFYEPHWLSYAFDKRYLPILSFPHITLHFLPTGRFNSSRPSAATAAPAAAT